MNIRAANFFRSSMSAYLFAGLGSILLSLWISGGESVINTDAICYLQSADTIGKSGLRDAMHLCGQARWPFYSLLIFLFSTASSLSYIASAYILNAFFSLMSALVFIAIIKEIGGSRRVLWLAAMVFLLAHEVNSVKQYIIRDHGFWAFYLLSCYLLLRYFDRFQRRYALAWNVSLLVATLFRIEGAFFLLMLPWVAWFYQKSDSVSPLLRRFQSFVELNALTVAIIVALLGWLAFHPEQSLADWGRLQEVASQSMHGGYLVWQQFHETAANLAKYVLTPDSARDAYFVLFCVTIIWYVQNIITNLSVAYALLFIYAWWKKIPALKLSDRLVLLGYLIINILITAGFFLQHLFLSKRYLIALSMIFMLWVPFALDYLIQQRRTNARVVLRGFLPFAALLIIISALGGIFDFGYSKLYIHDAGNWLAGNVPKTARLYSNDSQVMYYSQHFGEEIFYKAREYADSHGVEQGEWTKYDFLAIRTNKKELSDPSSVLYRLPTPIKVFANKRGDQVRIYQIISREASR
ncbi:MAG: hypothetical protein A3E84_02675 [Gammaproteobacteria bacterium RIFCSPHIGHO2_12_FULL_42_13]|nr:MAG: hypothetical protein A3E84_02675 [Gammaproteobacteria bacterium RIFCSPHIGHO2_12_FULL_42_13]